MHDQIATGNENDPSVADETPLCVLEGSTVEPKDERDVERGIAPQKEREANHLWRDILPSVDHSEFAYSLVKIRNAAREGKVTDRVLHPPFPLDLVLKVLEDNDATIEDLTGANTADTKRRALRMLGGECVFDVESAVTERAKEIINGKAGTVGDIEFVSQIRRGVFFIDVCDENQNEDMVYYIALSHARKSIYVVFRGSATPKDFMIDFTMKMRILDNPVHEEGLDKQIRVHGGFYEYLLKPRETGTSEKPSSKFDAICEKVDALSKENPGYEVVYTGHSLGAALSSLCAFFAAAAADALGIETAIKCINIGSPKVGDDSLRKAFEALEKKGSLLQLRIVNEADPIPRMPRRDPVRAGGVCFFLPGYRYRHVGMCLVMFGKPSFQVACRRILNPFYWILYFFVVMRYHKRPSLDIHNREYNRFVQPCIDVLGDLEFLFLSLFLCFEGPKQGSKFHKPHVYRERLHGIGDHLAKLTFHDIYRGMKKGEHGNVKVH